MDIAAMSSGLTLANIQMQASLSVTKNTMETAESQAAQLIESMVSANPPSSHTVDMYV